LFVWLQAKSEVKTQTKLAVTASMKSGTESDSSVMKKGLHVFTDAFSASMLFGIWPVKTVVRYWHSYLSGARCK